MLVGSAAAQAKGGSTACTGTIGNINNPFITINGNLTVPPSADCTLEAVVVNGNVSVGQGATLLAAELLITGNLSAEGASVVNLNSSEVDGNTRIDATNGPGAVSTPDFNSNCPATGLFPVSPSVCFVGVTFGGTKGGNVSITNTSPGAVGLAKEEISGNLSCVGNATINDPIFLTVDGRASGQCAGF
jgi:hypothetical protein